MKIRNLGPTINSFRALVGSIIVTGYVAVSLWKWVRSGSLSGPMMALLSLVVVSSIVGLYGRGALSAAASVLQGNRDSE